jgi:hypothetical protein
MGDRAIEIKTFALSGTKSGKIEVAKITNPYGEDSDPVASIGIFLDKYSEEPDWKVHIPKENIDEVIAALQEVKSLL